MSISCKHGHLRRQCELCDAEQEIATLTARLNAQCKLREEREQENDALAARVAMADALLARPGEDMMVDGKPMNWWDVHATYVATYRATNSAADGRSQS